MTTRRPGFSPSRHASRSKSFAPVMSDKIMRRGNFSGRLHRGQVSDKSRETVCFQALECRGCEFINMDYATQLQKKFNHSLEIIKQSEVLSSTQILPPVPGPNTTGYRALFKLAVRPAEKVGRNRDFDNNDALPPRRFAIGLFEPGTHKVSVPMSNCPIHVPALTDLLKDLEVEIETTLIEPYSEKTKQGELRYLVARSSHVTGEIMLTYVTSTPAIKNELIKFTQKLRRMGHKINACFMNINSSEGNAIFGGDLIHLLGAGGLRESLCDLQLEISPKAFFQVNPWQANQLYRRVELHAGRAQPGMVAYDLYTGTGQIALILARLGYRTLGIEEIPEAIDDAKRNAERNQLESGVTFVAARVEESDRLIPDWAKKPNLIVVNPSRRGIHESARSHLTNLLAANPQCTFVYVSCDAISLARDLRSLCESGHKVRQIEAFDMFPQTNKLEWIAVLTR
jgi:23S rRNA (uracil1939-C5)-methyltransferase